MDAKEVKRQIAYWESIQKDNKILIKTLEDTNKQVGATIKSLKGLLGKDEPAETPVVQAPDEVSTLRLPTRYQHNEW